MAAIFDAYIKKIDADHRRRNATEHIECSVPEAVWTFKIGGYQVCDKRLKDRKARVLSAEDISHYQRVVVALKETMRLMGEVDKAIPKWPVE